MFKRESLKTALVVFIVFLAGVLMIGCSGTTEESGNPVVLRDDNISLVDRDEAPPTALVLTSSTAWITAVSLDSANSTVDFNLLVSYDTLDPVVRSLHISGLSPSPSEYGLAIQLRDPVGAALWTYELTFDVVRDGDFTFVEQSPSDRMVILRHQESDGFTETYNLNGEAHSYEFQSTDLDHVISLEEEMLSAGANVDSMVSQLSEADQTIAAVIGEFLSHYETDNSLHGNVDARLVTDLLAQEAIYNELVWRNPDGTVGGPVSLEVSEICVVAADCAMLKCPVGLDLNPVCDACVVTLAICFVIEIYHTFFQ